jgi:hypothetical protein
MKIKVAVKGTEGSGAMFSADMVYRYSLWRTWDYAKGNVLWVMLNPSTADESVLDPTIRRCVGFTKKWGYGGVVICNIFALRSTDPHVLYTHAEPIGEGNDSIILNAACAAKVVICAWGVHGKFRDRESEVIGILNRHPIPLKCLGTTKAGHPRHPLYVSSDTELKGFKNEAN